MLGHPVGQTVKTAAREDPVVVIATGLTTDGEIICVYTWRPGFVCGFWYRLLINTARVHRQIGIFSIAVGA